MKKIISICTAICSFFMTFTVTGCAEDNDIVLTLRINDPVMTVNGVEKEIDPGRNTVPVIINDRTLLPVRTVMEELGGEIEWDPETQTVLLAYKEDLVTLEIGNTTAFFHEQQEMLDTAPAIINDRTMVPIRFIAESFGFDVAWDGDEQTVTISKPVMENTPVSTTNPEDSSRILTVYFSRVGNTNYGDDVDATTSASVVVENDATVGTTEVIAEMIYEAVGGDIARIETEDEYPEDFDELVDQNHSEQDSGYLPQLIDMNIDMNEYDTIFIGYPVWATSAPRAVIAFLQEYDLSGKKVIPFCTHDGYGSGGSYSEIRNVCPDSTVIDGLAIESGDIVGGNTVSVQNAVDEWINGLSINRENTENGQQTPISITIGETELEGYLNDTPEAEQFKSMLPITVSMVGYGGREYYGAISGTINDTTEGKLNFVNGDITYCPTNNTVAIFYAQTDRPDLTMQVISMGKVTSDLLVFHESGSREDITFRLKN